MRAACIAIGAACLAACCSACTSDDNGVPIACDGGDARAMGDALTSNDAALASDSQTASDTLATGDSLDASGVSDGGNGRADAVVEASAADATLSTMALVRFANWSPDAPAVDFCLALHGTTAFTGPVVAAIGTSVDAGGTGLAFPLVGNPVSAVSAYFPVTPGLYDVRVVVAMATSCGVPVIPDVTTLPALTAGNFATMALVGENVPSGGDQPLQIVSFPDDAVSEDPLLHIKFINGAPVWPQVDFGTGTVAGAMPNFTPIFIHVPFGHAASAAKNDPPLPEASLPTVDGNGYREFFASTFSNATLSVHQLGLTQEVATTHVSSMPGLLLTIALVGGTSAGAPPELLECVDNAGTAGALANCMLLP